MERGLSRREVWLCLLLATALSLGVGLYGRFVQQRVNWDGLAAVAHAYDVFHAEPSANLAMIGFVQPPLPALLQLPVVLAVARLATSGVAANLLGAVSLGVATVLLLGLAAHAGLSPAGRWALVALWLLHPMVLGPAATGSPLALLMALLMGTAWALVRWAHTQGIRDLIAASLLLSAVVITRYEAIFIVAGALIYLSWRTLRSGGSWSKLEGTLITFGLPIVYVAGTWILVNWAIMGDPWHFIHETFKDYDARAAEHLPSALVQVSVVCFFPILALVYHQMRGAGRRPAPGRPLAWLVLMAMAAPVVFPGLFGRLPAADDWGRLMTLVAMVLVGGYAMLAVLVGAHARGRTTGEPGAGTAVITVGSAVLLVWLLSNGLGLPGRATDAYLGRGPLADWAGDEIAAARLLRQTGLPQGPSHAIVGGAGFAVGLLADTTGQVKVVPGAEYGEQLSRLSRGSRLVTVIPAGTTRLRSGLEFQQRWRQGPWRCYEVVQESD